ncbi:MAG TPA: hypothetical protein VGJ91_15690 [Polyangiaceae bacterium]
MNGLHHSRVDMGGLDSEQRARVAEYWWSRAQGEMTSWVAFGHVLDDLRQEQAPALLLALAERAVNDEYQHALWCRDWALRFGHPGGEVRPRSTQCLAFAGANERENRLLRIALCCFTETVGCVLLRLLRPRLSEPELLELNHRHMADELQHSRVGWGYLATLSPTQKAFLAGRLSALFELLRATCCEGAEQDDEALVAFGYFTPRVLRAAHDEALHEIILPGLAHLSIRSIQ